MDGAAADLLTDRQWWRLPSAEKAGGPRVYVTGQAELPPARGRDGFLFRGDGRVSYSAPGRGDRPTRGDGTWVRLAPDQLRLTIQGRETLLELVALDQGRLELRWNP